MKHFLQELHQMLQSNLHIGFPSGVFDSTILPARVYLLLQRDDTMGQPVGGHANSGQVVLFYEVNVVG
jgi:hypothetical protein